LRINFHIGALCGAWIHGSPTLHGTSHRSAE
jgi:hypothetical protein